jgi:hypothetical protein
MSQIASQRSAAASNQFCDVQDPSRQQHSSPPAVSVLRRRSLGRGPAPRIPTRTSMPNRVPTQAAIVCKRTRRTSEAAGRGRAERGWRRAQPTGPQTTGGHIHIHGGKRTNNPMRQESGSSRLKKHDTTRTGHDEARHDDTRMRRLATGGTLAPALGTGPGRERMATGGDQTRRESQRHHITTRACGQTHETRTHAELSKSVYSQVLCLETFQGADILVASSRRTSTSMSTDRRKEG